MSDISEDLAKIQSAIYGEEVRGAIYDAISQCYSDVSNPTLQTEAIEAAIQEKIDAGEMAALTIADGSLTGAKLADGTIPTAKIADGAITMDKLSDDIDLDVDTDTTLSQSGVPADAKAVGDALAEAMTGEALEDGESMKFVLSSKYDDFKLVDGYGFFDAKKFFIFFDFNGAPYQTSDKNYIFRFSHTGKMLITEDVLDGFFSPDFLVQEHDFNGGAVYLPEGYWITVDPARPTGSRFVTVPRSIFGDSGNLGTFVFNFLDGSIGVKLDTEHLVEYDPSEVITAVATSTTYNNGVVEGITFYRGALDWVWSDLFDFTANNANFNRFFNSFGFNESYGSDYAKEYVYVNVRTPHLLTYSLKADAVGEHTLENVKDYLINTRHLKFYYVAPEPEEETT